MSEDDADCDGIVFSIACWRRYIGTWEIKDGRFYLVDIEGAFKKTEEEPLFADWFTGTPRAPRGERLQYVHTGNESIYEEELFIKIGKGVVVDTKMEDNRERDKK